ncbi:MAG: NUDIX domain-containing protein [Magnetospirillum sp.]|nr:NUDIX domain-containing protein [Magnetospirillum sp.]
MVSTLGRDDVEIIAKDTVFKGYFQVDRYRLRHRAFAGGWTQPLTREVFERGHAVSVLLYDPVRDEVALIEQFRAGALAAGLNPWLVEVVAGIIEDGESPEEVARREVREEAGCAVDDLVFISQILLSPGAVSETVRMYCARVDGSGIAGLHGLESEGEDIRVFTLATDQALAMVKDGRINNSVAVMSLLWLAGERDSLRKRWGVG